MFVNWLTSLNFSNLFQVLYNFYFLFLETIYTVICSSFTRKIIFFSYIFPVPNLIRILRFDTKTKYVLLFQVIPSFWKITSEHLGSYYFWRFSGCFIKIGSQTEHNWTAFMSRGLQSSFLIFNIVLMIKTQIRMHFDYWGET